MMVQSAEMGFPIDEALFVHAQEVSKLVEDDRALIIARSRFVARRSRTQFSFRCSSRVVSDSAAWVVTFRTRTMPCS